MAHRSLTSATEIKDQVLFAGNSCVKQVILNRPQKLNTINLEMIHQLKENLTSYENDPSIKIVILKGNGKAFCAGGDVVSLVSSTISGSWTYALSFYKEELSLDYLIATYKKPMVSLINGVVMGGGAGLSINATFKVVTEKAVFAMPETSIGLSPDVGASYFLSRLPGRFGEYLGLTATHLDGAEMVACGLATHFVPSKKLSLLENALQSLTTSDASIIATFMDAFTETAHLKEDSPFKRLHTINKCFSKATVEEIVLSLENEAEIGAEKWIKDALSYMRSASPLSLKTWLRSVREGRVQSIEQCLSREFYISCNTFRGTVNNDFFEGARAKLFDKENKPMWDPPKLELVSEDMVDQLFKENDDEFWRLQLPNRSNIIPSKL